MLNSFDYDNIETINEKRSVLGGQFAKLQRELNQSDSSMLVIIDGWESSGKGFILTDLTCELDPRFFKVSVYNQKNTKEEKYSFLSKFVEGLPGKGEMSFFNRSFYYRLFHHLQLSHKDVEHELMDISLLERLLVADGTLVVKIFLNQTKEMMNERIKERKASPHRNFLITEEDLEQLAFYQSYQSHMSLILSQTSFPHSPWEIISTAEGMKNASRLALTYCIDQLKNHLQKQVTPPFQSMHQAKSEKGIPDINTIDLTRTVSKMEYKYKRKSLQKRAAELVYQLWIKRIPCIIVFEGLDAAGKGGAIRRLRRWMDPRHYDVATTAAPTPAEDHYHYLSRFYKSFPEKGKMTIYDRSWYGRVLVERVESFTKEERWSDAYAEINEMEHNLVHEGHLLLKFLIVIDKDEQQARLEERKEDPEKSYKLTDEDWRNHEKFADYQVAMNEMLAKTSTIEAPWMIVEGNQKYYARMKVLKTFIEKTEAFLRNLPS